MRYRLLGGSGSATAVISIALLLLACSKDAPVQGTHGNDPVMSVQDSAGIELVWSSGPRFGAWEVEPTPSVVIGGAADAAGEVVEPVTAGRLPDGSLVVLDHRTERLLRYDRQGILQQILAGRGRGPGEVSGPEKIQVVHDTITLWEARYGKVLRLDATGKLVDERRIDLELVAKAIGSGGYSETFTPGPDGAMVAVVSRPTTAVNPEPGQLVRQPMEYVLITREMVGINLGTWLGTALLWPLERKGTRLPVFPLAPTRSFVTGGQGISAFAIADGTSLEVKVYDGAGGLWRIVRWDGGLMPMGRRAADSLREWIFRHNARTKAARATLERAQRELPPQPYWPATGSMFFDQLGCLWVQRPGTGWDVIGRDGSWLARVVVPLEQVKDAGDDWVLGIHEDVDDGLEVIELKLRRNGGC